MSVSPTISPCVTLQPVTAEGLEAILQEWIGPEPNMVAIRCGCDLPARNQMMGYLDQMGDLTILENAQSDPGTADIMALLPSVKAAGPDLIVAIGGGSTLDTAKALAILLDNGGDLDDYLGARPTRTIQKRTTRLIAIPTTAGTGSEATRFGVYTARSGRKYSLAHPALLPDMAVLVPELTASLPPRLTAGTGFDALSHALESLWNINATPESIQLATAASVAILQAIETAWDSAVSGQDAGRTAMLEAAHLAGLAFNLTGTAAVHALSFILSEEWHVPHGIACAFTLENVLKRNAQDPVIRDRLAMIARSFCNADTPEEQVDWLYSRLCTLKSKMGLPFTFSDLGISLTADALPSLFAKTLDDPKMANNARPMTLKEVDLLLQEKL